MLLHEGDMTVAPTSKPVRKRAARAKPAKPERPAHLAHGRWLGDLEDEAPLSDAENALVAVCARGKAWAPKGWDRKVPTAATPANTIRASLIRFLLLGGDTEHPMHEEGITAAGAWISGELNMYLARCSVRLNLGRCHLVAPPNLMAATLPELSLKGCELPGLRADRLVVTGGCYLDEGFAASGEVRLLNAEIGGIMSFGGGRFANAGANALSIGGLTAKRGLFLRNATVEGAIDLAAAHIGTLVDDMQCWQAGDHIFDGLRYDRIIGPTDAASRIAWLEAQHPDHLTSDFNPQPWEHLIKVLREMGHLYEAGEVAIAKQVQMRRAGVIKGGVRNVMHWLYGKIAGYGYRPIWTVYWMIWVWLACAFFFQVGGSYGYMGPTSPLLNNPELAAQLNASCGHRKEAKRESESPEKEDKIIWTQCPDMPPEYTTFQPLTYSLDLILPLVNLQQEADWAPIVSVASGESMGYGVFLRWLLWFEILFGWATSLILVAVLGRLVDKD